MGIQGLLPLLRSITRRVHLEKFAGQTVAVDAYCWLHKGVYGSCAVDLFHGRPNESFVEFCLSKVKQLLFYNIKPILVFDGGHLPMKRSQEQLRSKKRRESREKADELLALNNAASAHFYIQKCVDVTPQMAFQLITQLQRLGVEFVVAPYEADAQMAWLSRTNKVAAVITEDSDMLLFGCRRVLYKLDSNGYSEEICLDRLLDCEEIDLSTFNFSKFRHMCMLSGCDYLPSIYGMGLKTAYKYLCRYSEVGRVLQALRAEMPTKMPADYEADFSRAEMTFLHQRIYDTDRRRLAFLNPLPLDFDYNEAMGKWDFLGPELPEDLVQGICEGRICPTTRQPFAVPPPLPIAKAIGGLAASPGMTVSTEMSASAEMPFKIHLDRATLKDSVSIYGKTIAAARVSLKRSYSSNAEDGKKVPPPANRITSRFAFSRSELLKGIPVYLPVASAKGRGPLSTLTKNGPITKLDPKQRSIREFFK